MTTASAKTARSAATSAQATTVSASIARNREATEMPEEIHHHRILFTKCHPGYFVKFRMRYFHKLRNKFHGPIVNIENLWSLVAEDVKEKAGKDNMPMIDVMQFEDFQVLGIWFLPEGNPVVFKAKLVLKVAEKKIEQV